MSRGTLVSLTCEVVLSHSQEHVGPAKRLRWNPWATARGQSSGHAAPLSSPSASDHGYGWPCPWLLSSPPETPKSQPLSSFPSPVAQRPAPSLYCFPGNSVLQFLTGPGGLSQNPPGNLKIGLLFHSEVVAAIICLNSSCAFKNSIFG